MNTPASANDKFVQIPPASPEHLRRIIEHALALGPNIDGGIDAMVAFGDAVERQLRGMPADQAFAISTRASVLLSTFCTEQDTWAAAGLVHRSGDLVSLDNRLYQAVASIDVQMNVGSEEGGDDPDDVISCDLRCNPEEIVSRALHGTTATARSALHTLH